MLAFMQYLLGWLLANIQTDQQIEWVLGDPGASAPNSLPTAYVPPLFDTVQPLSDGVDTDTYGIPILIIDDPYEYGPPIENPDAPGTFMQPGFVKLMQYAEATRDALRRGGAAITFDGIVATSQVPAINYVWVQIDNKNYRGARIALQVRQRRFRGA